MPKTNGFCNSHIDCWNDNKDREKECAHVGSVCLGRRMWSTFALCCNVKAQCVHSVKEKVLCLQLVKSRNGILEIHTEKKMLPSVSHTKLLFIMTVGMLVQPLGLIPNSLFSVLSCPLHICKVCPLVAFI